MVDLHAQTQIVRSFAKALRNGREAFVADILVHDGSAPYPTFGGHLFVEAFLTSLLAANDESDCEQFLNWTKHAVSGSNVLRPPKNVAQALGPVLSQVAAQNGFPLTARPLIQTIVDIIEDSFASSIPIEDEQLDIVDGTINRLLSRLETQDSLTAEHSRAVGSWCSRIARCLYLTDSEAKEMSRAGLVHDIGKIAVPERILTAPRALTESEWVLMRAHTVHGDQMADGEEVLHPYRSAIRHHHERLDGTGYPDGLRGAQISLQAQVVAVADAFNAMIGRRPYRDPLPPAYALEQLEIGARTHFDPEIVRALRTVLSS